jgi:integrase
VSERLHELVRERQLGTLSPASKTTLGEWFDRWLDSIDLRPKTVSTYREALSPIRKRLGQVRLTQLKPAAIQMTFTALRKEGCGPRRMHQTHVVLGTCLKQAVQLGLIAQNPVDRVARPLWQPRQNDTWTLDQLHSFMAALEASESRWRHLWVFLLSSGLRIGEAMALEWSDLDGNRLQVNKSLTRFSADAVTVGVPKTRAGVRTITLPEQALAALELWREGWKEARSRYGWTTSRIFVTEYGSAPNLPNLHRSLRTACEHADVPYPTIHGLRHIHSSLLIANGVNIKSLQTRLGHANAAVTMRIYAHLMTTDDRNVADLVQNALSPE